MNQPFLFRLVRWFVKRIGTLTLLRFLLLWLALECFASGLIKVVRDLQVDQLLVTVFFSVLLAWWLASPRQPGWRFGLLAAMIGPVWLILIVGRLLIPLGVFASSLFDLYSQFVWHLVRESSWLRISFPSLDVGPLVLAWNGLLSGLAALSFRLFSWINGTISGKLVLDTVVSNLLWNAAVWMVSVWAVWFVRRKRSAIAGLCPSVALLAYLVYYTGSRSSLIWLVFLGGAMALSQAVNGYLFALERWQAGRMDRVELEPFLMMTALGLTTVLMLAGGLMPSISIKDIRNRIQNYMDARRNEQLAKSLGLEQTPGAGAIRSVQTLPPVTYIVGAGPHLPHDVVMYVSVDDYTPIPPSVLIRGRGMIYSPTFYFRSQTYDYYTGVGWEVFPAYQSNNQANVPLLTQQTGSSQVNYRSVRQQVHRLAVLGQTLYVSGELLTVDQSYRTTWRAPGDLIGAQVETDQYSASSRLPEVPVSLLRSAGTNYPAQIRKFYLQLPDSLPPRVRSLALDLTAAQATPYDQASAIEAYLRAYPYTLDVPAPPLGSDAADYFLFSLKKGFCNYYSTAMVVLARAAGIPARTVIGYASGYYDYDRGQFVITAADAHAWVEIYFPDIGWVEFEPTPNLPTIAHPGSSQPTTSLSFGTIERSGNGSALRVLFLEGFHRAEPFLIVALAVLLICLFLPIGRWSLLMRPPDRAVTTIYHRLYRQGKRWAIVSSPARTPHEFAIELADHLSGLANQKVLASTIPAIHGDVDWLTVLYSRLLYSPYSLKRSEQRRAIQVWYRVRRRLNWVRWIGTISSQFKTAKTWIKQMRIKLIFLVLLLFLLLAAAAGCGRTSPSVPPAATLFETSSPTATPASLPPSAWLTQLYVFFQSGDLPEAVQVAQFDQTIPDLALKLGATPVVKLNEGSVPTELG